MLNNVFSLYHPFVKLNHTNQFWLNFYLLKYNLLCLYNVKKQFLLVHLSYKSQRIRGEPMEEVFFLFKDSLCWWEHQRSTSITLQVLYVFTSSYHTGSPKKPGRSCCGVRVRSGTGTQIQSDFSRPRGEERTQGKGKTKGRFLQSKLLPRKIYLLAID